MVFVLVFTAIDLAKQSSHGPYPASVELREVDRWLATESAEVPQ